MRRIGFAATTFLVLVAGLVTAPSAHAEDDLTCAWVESISVDYPTPYPLDRVLTSPYRTPDLGVCVGNPLP